MPLKIVRNDITKMEVDAIVNSASKNLLGGCGGNRHRQHNVASPTQRLSEAVV